MLKNGLADNLGNRLNKTQQFYNLQANCHKSAMHHLLDPLSMFHQLDINQDGCIRQIEQRGIAAGLLFCCHFNAINL